LPDVPRKFTPFRLLLPRSIVYHRVVGRLAIDPDEIAVDRVGSRPADDRNTFSVTAALVAWTFTPAKLLLIVLPASVQLP